MADYYSDDLWDPEDWANYLPELNRGPQPPSCDCCGATGLHWGQYQGRWRLYQGDQLHRCWRSAQR